MVKTHSTWIKKLRKQAMQQSKQAYSPYSKALVGCALLTGSKKIFVGQNIENSSFGATVCAERVAIFNAITKGEKIFQHLYVYTEEGWPPCGMCLQVMAEFAHPERLFVTLGNKKGMERTFLLKELFPLAFTPEFL